jgi:hypothetical protein
MKAVITKEDVSKAMAEIRGKGKEPTFALLHAALNYRGSMSTLTRLKSEVDADEQRVNETSEEMQAFRQIWAKAAGEGRKQEESLIAELQERVAALMGENERLECVTMAAQQRADELEKENHLAVDVMSQTRIRIEGELSLAKSATAAASAQAANALQQLADTRSQVILLQGEVAAAVARAREIELKMARAQALLDAWTNQVDRSC